MFDSVQLSGYSAVVAAAMEKGLSPDWSATMPASHPQSGVRLRQFAHGSEMI